MSPTFLKPANLGGRVCFFPQSEDNKPDISKEPFPSAGLAHHQPSPAKSVEWLQVRKDGALPVSRHRKLLSKNPASTFQPSPENSYVSLRSLKSLNP